MTYSVIKTLICLNIKNVKLCTCTISSVHYFGYCRGKGKLRDECGSGQNSDRTLPRVEFSNSKFGLVLLTACCHIAILFDNTN